MRRNILLIFLIVFSGSGQVVAQFDSAFHITAGVDVYYGYDFNRPLNRNRQYVTVAARHNEFNLNWGFIKANYDDNRIRANMALHTGTYPVFNYANEPSDLLKLIAEANAGIRISDMLWVDVGIMPSHIGYENTFSFHNEMYTHSFMAEHTPYFSTGIQFTAALSESFDFRFVVLNGWQNIAETNSGKSVGIQLNYRPAPDLELNYSNYLGNESPVRDDIKLRFYNHFYAKYFIQDNWHIVGSFDYGRQELLNSEETGNLFAFLAITQYDINEHFNIAARLEHFNDQEEILVGTGTPNGFTNSNLGIALNYFPVSFAKLRIEGRSYTSPDDIYDAGENDSQNTFLLVGSLAVNLK